MSVSFSLYYSGVSTPEHLDVLRETSSRGVVDASYMTEPELASSIGKSKDIHLAQTIAPSTSMSLDDYAEIALDSRYRFDWITSLSVKDQQQLTNLNWRLLKSRNANTVWTYHLGGNTPLNHFRVYTGLLDIVAVSGLSPIITKTPIRAKKLLAQIGKVLEEENTQAILLDSFYPPFMELFTNATWLHSITTNGFSGCTANQAAKNITQLRAWMESL